jgi:hypothetical protein
MKKGQHEVVSAVIISGILITMVSSVYFWGLPLIYKSRDTSSLSNSESFMFFLDKTIKNIATAPGSRENIRLSEPGLIRIADDKIIYSIKTEGTIYATDAAIPLGETDNCDSSRAGKFGIDEPAVICVSSNQISESEYTNVYSLSYRNLETETGLKAYKIRIMDVAEQTGSKNTLIIENNGINILTGTDGKEITQIDIKVTLQ